MAMRRRLCERLRKAAPRQLHRENETVQLGDEFFRNDPGENRSHFNQGIKGGRFCQTSEEPLLHRLPLAERTKREREEVVEEGAKGSRLSRE